MPVIKHKDIEIHYEFHNLNPHLKVFHQDLFTISHDTDMNIRVFAEGQAKADLENMGDNHPNGSFANQRFNEKPPLRLPSYNYLTCETRKKKFPFPDILGSFGIIGPNQLLISYKLMGIFQKFRMAPHITIPAVIKFRDTYIDDNYLVLYFYHHGCDHVVWDKTVFAYIDPIKENILDTFDLNDYGHLKEFYSDLPKQRFVCIKLTFFDKFDIFYSFIGNRVLVNKKLKNDILIQQGIKGIICSGNRFETNIIKDF